MIKELAISARVMQILNWRIDHDDDDGNDSNRNKKTEEL